MSSAEDRVFLKRAIETSISIGLIALLVIWCFQVVRPFISPVAWGVIIAVAIHPLYLRLSRLMGGRAGLAAAVLAGSLLLLLLVPSFMITASLVESATELAGQLKEGAIDVPRPPAFGPLWLSNPEE